MDRELGQMAALREQQVLQVLYKFWQAMSDDKDTPKGLFVVDEQISDALPVNVGHINTTIADLNYYGLVDTFDFNGYRQGSLISENGIKFVEKKFEKCEWNPFPIIL